MGNNPRYRIMQAVYKHHKPRVTIHTASTLKDISLARLEPSGNMSQALVHDKCHPPTLLPALMLLATESLPRIPMTCQGAKPS